MSASGESWAVYDWRAGQSLRKLVPLPNGWPARLGSHLCGSEAFQSDDGDPRRQNVFPCAYRPSPLSHLRRAPTLTFFPSAHFTRPGMVVLRGSTAEGVATYPSSAMRAPLRLSVALDHKMHAVGRTSLPTLGRGESGGRMIQATGSTKFIGLWTFSVYIPGAGGAMPSASPAKRPYFTTLKFNVLDIAEGRCARAAKFGVAKIGCLLWAALPT